MRPTKLDLVINLTAAKAIGLSIPGMVPSAGRPGDRIKTCADQGDFLLHCICRFLAHRDVLLILTASIAIEGTADMKGRVASAKVSRLTPTETCAAQDFRSAKALFVPELQRDIVPSIACTRPPAGGVAWQATSNDENS
jgi:hypothetical protein